MTRRLIEWVAQGRFAVGLGANSSIVEQLQKRGLVVSVMPYFKDIGTHVGAGSGTSELAASLLALANAQVPATLNYEEPDPDCPVVVRPTAQPVRREHVLKVSFTEMGQCAAVVCRRWESR